MLRIPPNIALRHGNRTPITTAKRSGNKPLFAYTANQMAASRNGKIATRTTVPLTTLPGLQLTPMEFKRLPQVLMKLKLTNRIFNLKI